MKDKQERGTGDVPAAALAAGKDKDKHRPTVRYRRGPSLAPKSPALPLSASSAPPVAPVRAVLLPAPSRPPVAARTRRRRAPGAARPSPPPRAPRPPPRGRGRRLAPRASTDLGEGARLSPPREPRPRPPPAELRQGARGPPGPARRRAAPRAGCGRRSNNVRPPRQTSGGRGKMAAVTALPVSLSARFKGSVGARRARYRLRGEGQEGAEGPAAASCSP